MSYKREKSLGELNDRREPVRQFAALCHRQTTKGAEVLLITTRETKRWLIPKGWPIAGLKPRKVAEREAWEEAGVIGRTGRKQFGTFFCDKVLANGDSVPSIVDVYLLKVRRQRKRFPEMNERKTAWLKPVKAAKLVQEPELQRLLLQLDERAR